MEGQSWKKEVVPPFKICVAGLGSWTFHLQQGRVTLTAGELPAGFSFLVGHLEAPAVSRVGGALKDTLQPP